MLSLRNAMRSFGFLLVLLACILQLVSAQGSNAIVVPPAGFQITAGQPTTIEYTNPSLRTVTIQLIPASPGGGSIITLATMLPANGSATLLIPSDVPTTQLYEFKILDDSNSSNVNISPAFKIYPPYPSLTPTSTATSSTATAGSTSSTSTSSKSALSIGAIVGISVGVAGGLLLLIGIAIFFLHRRRKHKTWIQDHQHPPPPGELAPPYDMNHQYDPMHMQQQPQTIEVPGSRSWPRELEAEPRFHPREVVELPAEPVEGYSGLGKR